MRQLVYISAAKSWVTGKDITEILERSQINNKRLGITGLLLYRDQEFMQVIEGEDGAIETLFQKIADDQRHSTVITLIDEPITAKEFPDWSMALKSCDKISLAHVVGARDFREIGFDPDYFRQNPSEAKQLLMYFKNLDE